MQLGYVAMLDVLGFSALVTGDPSGQRFNDYLQCVENATKDTRVKYVVFSDTIVFTTEDSGPDSLLTMAKASSRLFHDLLQVYIPIRGAIAFGNFSRSTVAESVFVAGSAVIEAYHFEQQQDWVGVMLTPSARACVTDLDDRCNLNFKTPQDFLTRVEWATVIQRCQSIPFHERQIGETNVYDGFAIVPRKCKFEAADVRDSIHRALGQLEWLRGIAPSPESQAKYQRALLWLSNIRERWRGVAQSREAGHL
jgi:hypothetical protein